MLSKLEEAAAAAAGAEEAAAAAAGRTGRPTTTRRALAATGRAVPLSRLWVQLFDRSSMCSLFSPLA